MNVLDVDDLTPDELDIAQGTSPDCNGNGIPDECDLASGYSQDCNGNGIPDECDIESGLSQDCNENGIPDSCDLAGGTSNDCNGNGIPDECDIKALLIGVPRSGTSIYEIDPDSGTRTFLSSVSGISGFTGLSRHPMTDEYYAIVRAFDGTRPLAKLDPFSGTIDIIGDSGLNLSDIDFRSDGTLYGIAGNNNSTPGELFTLDLTDGTATSTLIVAGSGGGHSIAFLPGTEMLYHAFNSTLEVINVDAALAATIGNFGLSEVNALTYEVAEDRLLGENFGRLYAIDPGTAESTFIGNTSTTISGMTFQRASGDLNQNAVPDECDIADGTSEDCNSNGIPDEVEPDCNSNGIPDECDILNGTSVDIIGPNAQPDGIPDECQLDCNANLIPDDIDIALGISQDCNANLIPDECDIADGTSTDCNVNGVPDECDLTTSQTYEVRVDDLVDVTNDCGGGSLYTCSGQVGFAWQDMGIGTVSSVQVEFNVGVECHSSGTTHTTSLNGLADSSFASLSSFCSCSFTDGQTVTLQLDPASYNLGGQNTFHVTTLITCLGYIPRADWGGDVYARVTVEYTGGIGDCNANGVPDECDIATNTSLDINANGIPDECEP
jgi:hypothetical protein